MEALRKIVSGSALGPLFSLPHTSDELQYEVIVLPFVSGSDTPGIEGRESLSASLCGSLGDCEFEHIREPTPPRGTSVVFA